MEPQTSEQRDPAKPGPSLLDVFAGDGHFRIESWYPILKKHTFRTEIFDLQYDEAKVLVRYRELQTLILFEMQEERQKLDPNYRIALDVETVAEAHRNIEKELSSEETAALGRFTEKLEAALKPFVESAAGGAFVKTSSRSPKDAAFLTSSMRRILRDGVANNITDHPDVSLQEALSLDAISFVRAATQSMKVRSAREALDLFLSSKRTKDDIGACILQLGEKDFDMKIIVREWVDLLPEWEFRAFIFNGEMTSLTQYWTLVYVKEMAQNADAISKKIYDFWAEHIKPLLKFDCYTIDFVIDGPEAKDIRLIELNPPPPAAGQSLFSWDKPADRKIICEGPFEFRVQKNFQPDPLKGIHPASRQLIQLMRGNENTERNPSNIRCDCCSKSPISKYEWYSCRTCGVVDACPECFSSGKAIKVTNLPDIEEGHVHSFLIQKPTIASEPEMPLPSTTTVKPPVKAKPESEPSTRSCQVM